MEQVIRLLPDNIANQIAAGEVVQRPASVVKELLENAVDAGASRIDLIIKDAGKTLVQVIDNGSGMNAQDARMCFERHATSKIRTSADLFNIRTMGFRGEAMASIAAIAQVQMKTRVHQAELGTEVLIEGNEIKRQEPVMTAPGTVISVKNLFFNVPARRNFLKSNPVETRHIMNEFVRVAMAQPELAFSFEHNGHQVYDLAPATLETRILQLFGKDLGGQLIPINEETPYIAIGGYIGTPDAAKTKKGEQFFFVNRRFIKSHSLNHAITTAFDGLLPSDSSPFYFVFFDIDPSHVDINIHPTKTEIKFDDERTVYALLHSVIRKALGGYHKAPVLPPLAYSKGEDTTIADLIQRTPLPPPEREPTVGYQMPDRKTEQGSRWDDFYTTQARTEHKGTHVKPYSDFEPQVAEQRYIPKDTPAYLQAKLLEDSEPENGAGILGQIENRYILFQGKQGLLVVDQHYAHQRVLFEQFLHAASRNASASQQLLFPQTLQFSPMDFSFLREIEQDLKHLGFDLNEFGPNTYLLQGLPPELKGSKAEKFFEEIIAEVRENSDADIRTKLSDRLARSIAMRSALPSGRKMSREEMRNLCDQLFACQEPGHSPAGRPTYYKIDLRDLDRHFQRNS
jgi:DNA mismatch repair protein MutL